MLPPTFTMPETIFVGLVLACFAAFIITLAGVHLYVSLSPRRRCAPAPARVYAAPRTDHGLAA